MSTLMYSIPPSRNSLIVSWHFIFHITTPFGINNPNPTIGAILCVDFDMTRTIFEHKQDGFKEVLTTDFIISVF